MTVAEASTAVNMASRLAQSVGSGESDGGGGGAADRFWSVTLPAPCYVDLSTSCVFAALLSKSHSAERF
jgi:hypothetical protein